MTSDVNTTAMSSRELTLDELIDTLSHANLPNLVTLAVIGSVCRSRTLRNLSDIDTVFLFREVTAQSLRATWALCYSICTRLSTDRLTMKPEFRLGPFRPTFTPEHSLIQLHGLVFGARTWNQIPVCWFLKCKKEQHTVIGEPLPTLVSTEELLHLPWKIVHDPDGLNGLRKQLLTGRYSVAELLPVGERVVRRHSDYYFSTEADVFLHVTYTVKATVGYISLLKEFSHSDVFCHDSDLLKVFVHEAEPFLAAYENYARTGELTENIELFRQEGLAFVENAIKQVSRFFQKHATNIT